MRRPRLRARVAKSAAGARLEAERAQRAHAGDDFLHVLVEVGEAVERLPPRVVHVREMITQNAHAMNGNGSSATRPSRQSTPSVIIADDQHQRQRAVEAGEERFARGHLHGIDVVGGARHEVARALAMEVTAAPAATAAA